MPQLHLFQSPGKLKVNARATSIVSAAIGLVYANYLYQSYIIGEFAAFPEPVAKKLRRALYYSNYDIQPDNALKYYKQALAVAEEIGMDPFSDEILGVKFQLASFFEKQIHQPRMAIEVLERVKQNCLDWERELGGELKNREKRTRVLGQCVRMSVKLGELYAGPEIMESEHAEESLVWAVTTLLKEQSRREREGVGEEDGEWMNAEEIGGALECITSFDLVPQSSPSIYWTYVLISSLLHSARNALLPTPTTLPRQPPLPPSHLLNLEIRLSHRRPHEQPRHLPAPPTQAFYSVRSSFRPYRPFVQRPPVGAESPRKRGCYPRVRQN